MPRPMGSTSSRYSVYDRKTDMPLVINGTAKECAAAMRLTVDSFYSVFSRLKRGRPCASHKWEIFRDDAEDEE